MISSLIRAFHAFVSIPWNVSNATYSSLSKSVLAQETVPIDLAFSSDGTKMFITGNTGAIYQYTLSTAWNVSTATYASLSKTVTAQDATPFGLAFNTTGTKMFVVGNTTDTVYQYTL